MARVYGVSENQANAVFFQTTKLFGDIGGQLGLWIGISVMTLLEILQFFGEMAVHLCNSRRVDSIK